MIKLKNILNEDWSQKYKDSINCDNPKGFSQKAHCAGKEKNESANFTYAVVLSKEEFVKEETASDIIKDLDKVKNDLLKKVEVLIAKKKKLYANVDIESPMSAEEKKLDKDIADVFSQINQLVIQKRNLKKESIKEAKLIKVKFNDNDQTLYFSDGEKSKVDYDGEFKYKGKWFDTSDMSSSKDLEKMLSKAFPGTKFIQTESAKSDKLASLINNSINKVDNSLSYKDFAMAVGKILKDEYGSHLYSMFVQELNKELKKENESIKLTSLMMPKSNNSIKETFTQSIRNLFSELVPKEVYNATTPQEIEKKKTFVRDLVKTLNNFYRQHGVDWKFADTDFKFKMYSKN